jgi:hypothetical protein
MADELTYERAAGRILRFMAWIAAAGVVAAFIIGGWRVAAGFLAGALIAGLNFFWLKRLVDRLGGEQPGRKRGVALAFRYLLLGCAGYVIFRFVKFSLAALMAGVFVLTAAVFMEVAIEIVYARK